MRAEGSLGTAAPLRLRPMNARPQMLDDIAMIAAGTTDPVVRTSVSDLGAADDLRVDGPRDGVTSTVSR